MTWCEAQFQRLSDSIKLDPTRRGRIYSAIANLEDFSNNDDQLGPAKAEEIFLQGSVATNSVVKPLAGDEFDVDLVYPFKLDVFNQASPDQIMRWFESRFELSDFYRPRLIKKNRCVRIDYAGDFHLDVTPATKDVGSHRPWAIATKESQNWESTDPVEFADWVRSIDAAAGGLDGDDVGRFVRCVRYMKRWRDTFFSEESAPTSIVLVTALGRHHAAATNYNPPLADPLFPKYQTDAAFLYDMLRLTHSCILSGRASAFLHPILNQDLAEGWAENHLAEFMARLSDCISHLRSAIFDQSEQSSIQHYKAALGATFPN